MPRATWEEIRKGQRAIYLNTRNPRWSGRQRIFEPSEMDGMPIKRPWYLHEKDFAKEVLHDTGCI